jgi:DNA-binding winged helix-turn-helix (wHTH) protein
MVIIILMKIRFSDFELDEERYSLTRDGQRVALRPKVFDLLVELVRNRSRVVRREELVGQLWGGFAVGAGSLSGLVNELRQALGEEGRGASSIRTVHARGYQFIAPTDGAENSDEEEIISALPNRAKLGASRAASLIQRVTEEGACGILISAGSASLASAKSRSERPHSLAEVLSEAESAHFEIQSLLIQDEALSTSSHFANQIIGRLLESRGEEAVRSGLPFPARVWFDQSVGEKVAGGFVKSVGGPPGGLGAVGCLLSELARRRPIAWVLEGVDRAGSGIARDLAVLQGQVLGDPVLWIGVLGPDAVRVGRDIQRQADFAHWDADQLGAEGSGGGTRTIRPSPLPAELREALVEHMGGDVAVVDEIAAWIEAQREQTLEGARHHMRRVDPSSPVGLWSRGRA